MSWRDNLRPASFRGVEFKVEVGARTSGRRGPLHEFPKRDDPYFEDTGRAARRWSVQGYVIGDDYADEADGLERALCESDEPGQLIHPTMGELRCVCQHYTRSERRTEGNMAVFDMAFVEAGSPVSGRILESTGLSITGIAGLAGGLGVSLNLGPLDISAGLGGVSVGLNLPGASGLVGGLAGAAESFARNALGQALSQIPSSFRVPLPNVPFPLPRIPLPSLSSIPGLPF